MDDARLRDVIENALQDENALIQLIAAAKGDEFALLAMVARDKEQARQIREARRSMRKLRKQMEDALWRLRCARTPCTKTPTEAIRDMLAKFEREGLQ